MQFSFQTVATSHTPFNCFANEYRTVHSVFFTVALFYNPMVQTMIKPA